MPVFSQSENNEADTESADLEAFDENFDSMFDEASDTEAVIVVDPKASVKNDDGTYPLRFSGHLDSEFGLGWQYFDEYIDGKESVQITNANGKKENVIQDKIVEGKNDPNGYFTFTNYLYLNSHPTPDTMVKGTFAMGFPGYEFAISECYFDYIVNEEMDTSTDPAARVKA